MNKSKLAAARLIVEAIGVLLVAIFVVMRYETQIIAINWRLVSLVCAVAVALFAFYRWQMREDNSYDALDMFMKDGHADLYAHITVLSFALAVWVVVQQALAKQAVTELVLGVLGIFVVGKAAGGFSDAMQRRPPAQDASANINITAAPAPKPSLPLADGAVEPLAPKIGPEDVGKNVALVSNDDKMAKLKAKRRK